MRAVRIAQLANFVGPSSGGMRTAVDALGRGYVAAGAERLLVVPGPADSVSEGPDGVTVQVRAPRVHGGYRLIVEPWRVVDVLERFAPTSVEVNDKLTLLPVARWARRRGVGTVLFSHERLDDMVALLTRVDSARYPVALLNRVLVRSFDRLVVASHYAEREFRGLADAVGCSLSRVPLGVDLHTFTPPLARHEDDVLRLVLVSRLSREKSPELAVATALELHRRGVPVRLDVYGDGPQRDELRDLAAGAPVVLHGYVGSRDELAARIGAADVALSVCPGETFGLAVLEALACGTPVVTADSGGAAELVCGLSGASAAARPDALADAVLDLAARPRDLTRRAARRRAEQFDWPTSVAAMLDLHAELGGRSGLVRLPA
ncbi:glycosyltransferase [Nocardioides sp. GY 10127]|uniref:glycosyltransferase n=1 Tax=Nocardioides sp. GY 10127 TaxID=2569762 RepID=UPI0010A852B9|nr:glycosyltransferase [Nocardioides sp. GY 10127]TIC79971.1 glycosyltransferase family 1 protein [Nocardioides sp. GY 10127]